MQDGCKVCMDSYMASSGSCFHGHRDYFQKPPLGGRSNTKPRDHGTPIFTTIGLLCFIMCEDPALIEIHCNNIWLRVPSHVKLTLHLRARDHTT
jgi:hypothetical protein